MTLLGKTWSEAEILIWAGCLLALHLAWAREVLTQVKGQTRLYALMPADLRHRFPDHPASPRTVVFASTRFFLAFLRYISTDAPEDPAEITAVKVTLRASTRRATWFAGLGVSALVTCVALVALR